MKFALNTLVAALIIAGVTELSRRFSFLAALLVSLPITSVIALAFVYVDTKDTAKVSELSTAIFWLVIPSLGFFLLLPALLKSGVNFWLSLTASSAALAIGYFGYAWALRKFGFSI
jgi:hypothetical protein